MFSDILGSFENHCFLSQAGEATFWATFGKNFGYSLFQHLVTLLLTLILRSLVATQRENL